MKSFLMLILCFVLFGIFSSSTTWADYEDNPEVQKLVEAGKFEISFHACGQDSSQSSEYSEYEYKEDDVLFNANKKICLHNIPLPSAVESEVGHMRANELQNESDYDQRITSILHFSWKNLESDNIVLDDVINLFSVLNVSVDPDKVELHSEVVNQSSFSEFDDLFIDLFFKVNSSTQEFIRSSFQGELVQVVKFEEGVELYPGGGFYVTHYMIISLHHAMYIKLSWWNS